MDNTYDMVQPDEGVPRNATCFFTYAWRENEAPVDLSGMVLEFIVRSGSLVKFTLTIGSGIVMLASASGIMAFSITALVMTATPAGVYKYEARATYSGRTQTLVKGNIEFYNP